MMRHLFYSLLAACILLSGCAATNTKPTAQAAGNTDQIAAKFQKDGNVAEALQYYAEAIEEHETPQLHNGAGTTLLEGGNPKEALAEFNRALVFMPTSAKLHTNKGTAEILLGDEKSAEESFDKALSYAPSSPAALNGKALIMLHKKEYESALILLVKASKFAPADRAIMFNKALSFEGTGLLEDADKTLTLILEENPKDAEVRNARGIVRMKRKQYALARDDFTCAIALSPATGIFYYNKAILQQRLMEYEKAITNYTRSVAYDPTNPAAYINRGESYFLLGKKLRGCNDLKKACSMGLCKKLESYESARLCNND